MESNESYKVGNGVGDMKYAGGMKNAKEGHTAYQPGNNKHDMKYAGGVKDMKELKPKIMTGKFNMKYAKGKKTFNNLASSMAKLRVQAKGKHLKKGA